MKRIYGRAEAGLRAWRSSTSGLPPHYRRILGVIRQRTEAASVYAQLPEYSVRQLNGWLDELDTLGFVVLLGVQVHTKPATSAASARRPRIGRVQSSSR